ncbi:MAG: TPM domain-containing protein [Syntrophorhabdaceae bacterium]|nr:TPM domain-containing protein [Syntrophorhabdaceae bacterium]
MGKRKADKFFTEVEKKRIKEAIVSAESKTMGEIATMIVDESDEYRDAEMLGAILLSGLISLIITVLAFNSSLWGYIPAVFILFLPCRELFRVFPGLKLPFISTKRMEKKVMDRAIRSFYEKGLYRTRKHTGVLIFISILEKKVWVIADKGIYSKITQDDLNRYAQSISKGIREGRACEAIVNAIGQIGEVLEKHFPVSKDDVNELTDEMITEDATI